MKKWTVMLMAVTATAVVLSGCGSSNNNGGNDSGGNTANTTNNGGGNTGSTNTKNNAGTKSGDVVTIKTSITAGELSKDQIAEFEKEHPNIHVEIEEVDATKLAAELATGDAPDVIRILGVQDLPSYVIKGIATDLTDRINTSTVFKADDLMDITNVYRFDGKTVGAGPIYGLPKDWSNDYAIFYNKKAFDAAGVPLPSTTEPMTLPEFIDLAKKLTIKGADGKIKQYGIGTNSGSKVEPTYDGMLEYLLSAGVNINTDDFSSINFDNPAVKDYINTWLDAVKNNVGPNSVNNDQSDSGDLFFKNQVAMQVFGYWYSGVIRNEERAKSHIEDFGMLPTPIAPGGTRVAPTGSATGGIINAASKHPDEAWTFFEWYFGGKPADDRAKTGWGLPIFKSKMASLPAVTAFDKQVNEVMKGEIENSNKYIIWNPYLGNGGGAVFSKYSQPLLFGKSSIEDAIKGMTKDAGNAIEEAKAAAGQ
ncbi:sugar ABC transporter substrate-binding protein [Paenibacillus rhizovicinus]|uniref:Sugar ABC transporter substrate-binding protein n=1 Tax=Paenibacillus rhizovicinus TaxID=2704463 RepID=A0A6C0P077_9BACL|nr:sugar ABC transporter substrate-binding protein [Paenibacillus rhizovicinus]QHW31616.1 sugar ABC transporter substrate-binding protein [Paenibacillus rhizovicinus]